MLRRARRSRGGGGGTRAQRARAPRRTAVPAAARDAERLQKVLGRAGLASRREVEAWIRAGRLTINGEVATLGARVAASDRIRLDGRLVRSREGGGGGRVFLCHPSPGGPLTAAEGAAGAATPAPGACLFERLPRRSGRRFIAISPLPRVDGGLELVSSDGE